MRFTIDSKEFKEALVSLRVKGKHLVTNGLVNSSLSQYAYCVLKDGTLSMFNGDATFIANVRLDVESENEGTFVLDSAIVVPYLTEFDGDLQINVGDYVTIQCGAKKASVPLVVNHPQENALSKVQNMLAHVRYEPVPQTMFNFGKTSKFEGAFTLMQNTFKKTLKTCELVKSGIYKLDYKEGVPSFSTRLNVQNKYSESLEPMFAIGEDATIDFSGPLYAFFKSDQLLNFYMKDEFPLLIVSDDRMLIKAPYVNGE